MSDRAPMSLLVSFVLEKSEGEPIAKRIALYSALAEVAPSPSEARQFRGLAVDLLKIEHRHQQLALNLKFRTRPE